MIRLWELPERLEDPAGDAVYRILFFFRPRLPCTVEDKAALNSRRSGYSPPIFTPDSPLETGAGCFLGLPLAFPPASLFTPESPLEIGVGYFLGLPLLGFPAALSSGLRRSGDDSVSTVSLAKSIRLFLLSGPLLALTERLFPLALFLRGANLIRSIP